MKIEITGASNFVNRMYEACGPYQWARELAQNSMEAGATHIEFGVEWQAVERLGVYRRTVADNGVGMNATELLAFFSTLGAGSKDIGGVHENFGVGAKIACLPWNPEGLVVVSYKNGVGSMIWIVLDEVTGDYELVEFDTEAGKKVVIEPSFVEKINWDAIKPEWLTDHGTVVVLLGEKNHPHTWAYGEQIKGTSLYLNTRFWDLSAKEVWVVEPRSESPSRWPKSRTDHEFRTNRRRIWGAARHLTEANRPEEDTGGKLAAQGTLELDKSRVRCEWYLWEGHRRSVHTFAKETGFIALRYGHELYELTTNKAHFRWFGIVESEVQANLTIIVEPQHYEAAGGAYGVHPDQSRNRLIFTGEGEKGVDPPLSRWAYEFAEHMPAEVRAAIRAARGADDTGQINEEYRRRLLDRFGARWLNPLGLRAGKRGDQQGAAGQLLQIQHHQEPGDSGEGEESEAADTSPDRTRKRIERPTDPGNPLGEGQRGSAESVPVDIPRWRFAHRQDFDEPWHVASWLPRDEAGPTVLINIDSPVITEEIEYQQAQYPEMHHEEIANEIRRAYGEIAACRIAHSQRLARLVTEEELDRTYRNEEALTISLMGLVAEEALIVNRLKTKFRRTIEA